MIQFTAMIQKFGAQGEKTGWSYISVPSHLAQELLPGNKKAFRVKGKLDNHTFKLASLIPMGDGDFILAINATMRKATGKREGAMLQVLLEADHAEIPMPQDFKDWLMEDEDAEKYFSGLPKSHRHYWIKWLGEAKTEATRTRRLTRAVTALAQGFGFAEMLRAEKASKFGRE